MTRTQITLFEQFLLLFNALKDTANGDPERVKTFYAQHRQMREAAHHLLTFVWRGDFHRRALHGPKKYHWQVPEGFNEAYRDFIEKWEPALIEVWNQYLMADLKESLSELFAEDGAVNEEFSKDGDSLKADKTSSKNSDGPKPRPGDDGYELSEEIGRPRHRLHLSGGKKRPVDPDEEETFDPLIHDGADAFSGIFPAVQSYADQVDGSYHYDQIHVWAKVGLEAYEYLTETIGFAPKGVFRRWDKVPVIFMPAHVSNKHGLEKGSLNNLIDDAVKAYVFGAPAAAIAMCRAALEMILKQHYKLDYQYKDGKGRTRDKGLGELIILADEKYEFVQGARIRRYSDTANRVMHSYNRDKPLSDEDEKTILDFIRTLKFLIERAPDP